MSEKKTVLVAGDLILDHSRFLTYERQSPEEPVCPVGHHEGTTWALGGAGNAARWVRRLSDADTILIGHYARIGGPFEWLRSLARADDIEIGSHLERQCGEMTVKERIYLRGVKDSTWRQVVRIDRDTNIQLTPHEARTLCAHLELTMASQRPAILIIADYGKGVFTGDHAPLLLEKLQDLVVVHRIPTVVNSKYPARWARFVTDVLVCNEAEHQSLRGSPVAARHLLITKADKGVTAYVHGGTPSVTQRFHAPTVATDVQDVTGAGDAFLAGLTTNLVHIQFRRGQVLENGMLAEAVAEGQAAAAHCVGQLGCGAPWMTEVEG